MRTGKTWSGHQALTIVKHLTQVHSEIKAWPLIGEVGTKFMLGSGWHNGKPSFSLNVEDFLVSKIGAPSARIVSRNAAQLHSRLTAARADASDRSLPPALWRIEAKGRGTRNILARTPREAALKYSAIHLRSYTEARSWKAVRDDILALGRLAPHEEWQK